MFRHYGRGRTIAHNLRLATLLSLVAGMVNICGVFSIKTLTTNVTGHFAFFAEEIVLKNYQLALIFVGYVFCFLLGSFLSGFLTQITARHFLRISPVVPPMIIEVLTLSSVGVFGINAIQEGNIHVIASAMLFSMGIQNSLVTQVSNSIVRTTHLTGLFTDLGIELAQLFFYRNLKELSKLSQSIRLRTAIIVSFFMGCIIGGFLYSYLGLRTLIVASSLLLFTLFYDVVRYRVYVLRNKIFRNY